MFASFELIPNANRSNSLLDPNINDSSENGFLNIESAFDEIMKQDDDVKISSPVNYENQRDFGLTIYSDKEIA